MIAMKFMLIVKADKDSEAGKLPEPRLLEEMSKFNEELVKAGILVAAEGLKPTSQGMRIKLSKGAFTVTPGPFSEASTRGPLMAGYWVLDVPSKADALDWARRAPFEDGVVEVRPVDYTDFSAASNAAPGSKTKPVRYFSSYVTENQGPPSQEHMAEMGQIIDEAIKDGRLIAAGGLGPAAQGSRVQYAGSKRTVTDGPFAEAKELVAGWAVLRAESKQAVVEQVKNFLERGGDGECEVRLLFELEDFPASETIEREKQLRAQAAKQ
jgi:hypothetical protein